MRRSSKNVSRTYRFWLLPFDEFHQDEEHPFSEIHSNPQAWIRNLFWCNNRATGVVYQMVGSSKKITVERGNAPAFRAQNGVDVKRIENKYLRTVVVILFSIFLGVDIAIAIIYCQFYHITWMQWCNTLSFTLFLLFGLGKAQEKIVNRKRISVGR